MQPLNLFNQEALQAMVNAGIQAYLSSPEGLKLIQSFAPQQPHKVDLKGLENLFSIKRHAVYKDPNFPKIKAGKKLLFDVQEVSKYLDSLKVTTEKEIQSEVISTSLRRRRK